MSEQYWRGFWTGVGITSFAMLMIGTMGCGAPHHDRRSGPNLPEMYEPADRSSVVVVATASFDAVLDGYDHTLRLASTYPVVVTFSPFTTFTIDTATFVVPTIDVDVLDFGAIAVSALKTNELKLCGAGGNQKCGHALLRLYTTVAAGAGFWNATDAYGAPMTAGLVGALQTVLLSQASAITAQSYTIPASKNTLRLSDFSPTPNFLFKGDFTNAGVGTYSTTINVELALAP